MTALLGISLGAKVDAIDGLLGSVRAIIVSPISGEVTHLAVTNLDVPKSARLIPPSHITRCEKHHAQLDLTRREALACPRLVVPATVPDSGHHGRDEAVSAWFTPMDLLAGTYTFALRRRLPTSDSVLLARGKPVETVDGVRLGTIDDVIVDAASATVSQLVLTEGHFLGRRQVLIPATLIHDIEADCVHVDLTEGQLPHDGARVGSPRPAEASSAPRRADASGRAMSALVHRALDQHAVPSFDAYLAEGGGVASRSARSAPPNEIIALLQRSGLQGRGGAGFPTGQKWETVGAARSTNVDTTVVVNAAEGEPGTFKDRALLRTNPYRILEGAIVAAFAMQTDRIRIGLKATFGREVDRLTNAIDEMGAKGWLDGLDVRLVLGPSSYLFGEETAMLEVLEGRQPFPRVTPPYRRGLEDHDTRSAGGVHLAVAGGSDEPPALVDNVETLANVALIVARGAEWFREVGTDRSPGTIVCTVSGTTRRSGVGEVPMGTTLREVIDLIGWGPYAGSEIGVVLSGTSNALIPVELLDTPLSHEAMRDVGSGLGSAGFIVFDSMTDPLAIAAAVARFLSVESCGQCEPCKTDGLVIADLLDRAVHVSLTARERRVLEARINTVAIGARCNLARQQEVVAKSVSAILANTPRSPAHEQPRSAEPLVIAPILDLIGGRAIPDAAQASKQPDWSQHASDSSTAPAAFLGDTPVHITAPARPRSWPDWSATVVADHPLDVVDTAHEDIARRLEVAIADPHVDGRAVDDAMVAIRVHIDVTRRVLYPMLRRVGGEDGESLADGAEAQEAVILRSVRAAVSSSGSDRAEILKNISVELQRHADLEDKILELFRACLDPDERVDLANGLAEAKLTSTVHR